jgi:hypothetical protein
MAAERDTPGSVRNFMLPATLQKFWRDTGLATGAVLISIIDYGSTLSRRGRSSVSAFSFWGGAFGSAVMTMVSPQQGTPSPMPPQARLSAGT